jgi:hypothetical protein
MAVMQDDRWCAPWVDCKSKLYEVHFCVDGRGYVVNKLGESRCFESHAALAQFLENTKQATFSKGGQTSFGTYGKIEPDIWRASGSFDEVRNDRIEKAQTKALRSLFPVDPARASKPPLYVRPGEMPDNGGRSFCSSVADLLKLGATA